MQTVRIQAKTGHSAIAVGERLENLPQYVSAHAPVILTDARVRALYQDRFPPWPIIEIGQGERIKTLQTLETVYTELIRLGADRSCSLVGIGGGIVCDICGFAGSTYLRGVDCGFVATTLLAQVDASVGGKNGVNFLGYKNMVGNFRQPGFVICDPILLKSLPPQELACGLAEIVKHGAIADARLFAFMEENTEAILALEPAAMERLVADSVRIKAAVVQADEQEKGERRKLNFGHTFGHALEKVAGLRHGQAVSVGMVLAAEISVRQGLLSPEAAERIRALLENLGLPVQCPADGNQVLEALGKDKKREGERIHFVLLEAIGQARVSRMGMEPLRACLV